jgi:hypothetical protein
MLIQERGKRFIDFSEPVEKILMRKSKTSVSISSEFYLLAVCGL